MSDKRFDFKGKSYYIKPFDSKILAQAAKVYTRSFKKAVEEGSILKKSLDDHMRRQGLWDDKKQEEYTNLVKHSADIEYKIKSKFFKKASELRDKALELKKLRDKISSLLSVRNSMDSLTAEGVAENERFNFLVSCCAYDYATQKPVFSSMEDYLERADQDYAIECASKFANYYYGVEDNYEDSYIENKVLSKLNLLDKDGNLVDRQGRRVDFDGNLLDENGSRIDENGVRIDINNNPVIDDSAIESLEFEDDLAVDSPKTASKTVKEEVETEDL